MSKNLNKFLKIPDTLQLEKVSALFNGLEIFENLNQSDISPAATDIVCCQGLSPSEIANIVKKTSCSHYVSPGREDTSYELIMSALLLKQPENVIQPALALLLKKLTKDSQNKNIQPVLSAAFNNSKAKSETLTQLSTYIESKEAVLPYKHRIIQIADELITNAMFAAPVDSTGKHIFRSLDRGSYVEYYTTPRKASLKVYHQDNKILIGCEDPWGSIDEKMIRDAIGNAFNSESIDVSPNRPTGGLGLGLRMIMENSTSCYILCKKGELSSVYAGFDLGISNRKIESTFKHFHLTVV